MLGGVVGAHLQHGAALLELLGLESDRGAAGAVVRGPGLGRRIRARRVHDRLVDHRLVRRRPRVGGRGSVLRLTAR